MKKTQEKGITMVALTIGIILLLIILEASVRIGLDGLDSVDETLQAGSDTEKTSIMEALQGEIEDLRTKRLLKGQTISESDIREIMEAFATQYSELTYNDSTSIMESTKGFKISVDEVMKQCQIEKEKTE